MTRTIVRTVFVGLAAALVAGCTTTGYQRADKTASSMEATQQALQRGSEQVVRTLTALDAVVATSQGDLRPGYQEFTREVAALRRTQENVRLKANGMRSNADTYFERWGEEIESIQNPEIRRKSIDRRGEAMRSYDGIAESANAAADAYEPLLADLRDIETHLSQDLTAQGIEGAQGFVEKAKQDAAALQQKIQSVLAEIGRVSSEIDAKAETGI